MRQIVEGVSALHAAGKLHRDIKPTNVIMTIPEVEAKVLDFGLAADEFALKEVAPSSTSSEPLPIWRPSRPQDEPLSPASDWYSPSA